MCAGHDNDSGDISFGGHDSATPAATAAVAAVATATAAVMRSSLPYILMPSPKTEHISLLPLQQRCDVAETEVAV